MDEPLPNSPRILGQARSAWGDGAEPATPQALDMTTDDDPLPTPPPFPSRPTEPFRTTSFGFVSRNILLEKNTVVQIKIRRAERWREK